MRNIILNQSQQITHSLQVNHATSQDGTFDAIVVAGMGGSGHPGDLLTALDLPTVPLTIHRSYSLPEIPQDTPLIIISSYSGNTEEALTAYHAAQAAGYDLLVNTSGGTLADLALKNNVPWVKIDFPGMQPRHTLLASFTGLYIALKNTGLVKDITDDLLRIAHTLPQQTEAMEKEAKTLAEQLKGTTPVYTASNALAFAAKNFKIQTNENVKTPAFWNEFPELNHNEMIGFEHPQAPFHVVMLRSTDDHPRIKARMDVTAKLYQQWGVPVSQIPIPGETQLEKIIYGVTFGLWTTYHLAQAYGIDPVPVAGVENFKKQLEKIAGSI